MTINRSQSWPLRRQTHGDRYRFTSAFHHNKSNNNSARSVICVASHCARSTSLIVQFTAYLLVTSGLSSSHTVCRFSQIQNFVTRLGDFRAIMVLIDGQVFKNVARRYHSGRDICKPVVCRAVLAKQNFQKQSTNTHTHVPIFDHINHKSPDSI